MPRLAMLICVDCGRHGPEAKVMPEARELAEKEGWQTGMRGANRVEGWEEDYCEKCKLRHVRIYCDGPKHRQCRHRSLYTLTRRDDGMVVQSCGSHYTLLSGELVRGGHTVELTETPI